MKLIKKLSCVAFLAISSFLPSFGQAQSLGGVENGCSIKVMGQEIPCKRVWCPRTMSMSACNSGGSATSQTCDSLVIC